MAIEYNKEAVLATGELYHIVNRSIAEFKIFNSEADYVRVKNLIKYYQAESPLLRFSHFLQSSPIRDQNLMMYPESNYGCKEKIVAIIAYCIMPTHLHLILKQLKEKGITNFMNIVSNGYTKYFNTKHKRKGPLWEGRFKRVHVDTDEQLIHLTRYIHLNPVSAYLVKKPEDWRASSYKEYLGIEGKDNRICDYEKILEIHPDQYKKFVEDNIDYQRRLAKIKNLILEDDCPPRSGTVIARCGGRRGYFET